MELADVSHRYGGSSGTLALEHCSLKVREGEFAAVVGPSGCGKSTLMKLATGMYKFACAISCFLPAMPLESTPYLLCISLRLP
ncbi:ATP-binding cassette domain-containing protein, partial [Mycobacterium tuberculosis]|nr:ATP-binding cassette domain-containing protein [Mycobacterium tuberculosis]